MPVNENQDNADLMEILGYGNEKVPDPQNESAQAPSTLPAASSTNEITDPPLKKVATMKEKVVV